jgi:hypothetical protein
VIPPGLAISFQRFQCPETGRLARAPESLGALPIGYSAERALLLPLAANECFWIGLRAEDATPEIALAVAVTLRNGLVLDLLSGEPWQPNAPTARSLSGTPRLEGIQGPESCRVLARDTSRPDDDVARIRFLAGAVDRRREWNRSREERQQWDREVEIELVDYARFSSECGAAPPAPLDPDAGYKGWRLP